MKKYGPKLAKHLLFLPPFFLGTAGFAMVDGMPKMDILFNSLQLYALNYEETPQNLLIEIARWTAPLATLSGIMVLFQSLKAKEAQKLMRLIHENEFCRDIAIWYDEFPVPGKDFNHAIEDTLTNCDLFTLLVTHNLVNEENYVRKYEYPAAHKSGKPILPVEALTTNHGQLANRYPMLPHCVAAEDKPALSQGLLENLRRLNLRSNDSDPRHNFFIGLAYLNGIDVETDRERALALIQSTAEGNLPEAYKKLVSMYQNGEGVGRDYAQAAVWQAKLALSRKALWREQPTAANGYGYCSSLCELGDSLMDLGQVGRAAIPYGEMHTLCKQLAAQFPDNSVFRRCLSASYDKLAISPRPAASWSKRKGTSARLPNSRNDAATVSGSIERPAKRSKCCTCSGVFLGHRLYQKCIDSSQSFANGQPQSQKRAPLRWDALFSF